MNLRLSELLKDYLATEETKRRLQAYEDLRQKIANSGGKAGSRNVNQSSLQSAQNDVQTEKSQDDRFLRALNRGKAFSIEGASGKETDRAYGIFDKEGFTGAPRGAYSEYSVTPDEFKAQYPQVKQMLAEMTKSEPTKFDVGEAMLAYKAKFGQQSDIDPMRLKHLIMLKRQAESQQRTIPLDDIEELPAK